MQKIQHKSNNRVLGAPQGWDQDALPCGALPITDTMVAGLPCIVSFWNPSPVELETLNKGGSVALYIIGDTMPPVALEVEPK